MANRIPHHTATRHDTATPDPLDIFPTHRFDIKRFLFSPGAYIFLGILLISLGLRFYHLDTIKDQIFDEVYFPVFAQKYIMHQDFFDAHPPLGKLAIALGILSFGNNPLGWRFMNAVTGVLLLGAVYGFTYSLTKSGRTALLALILAAVDPMALAESRIGVINIYLAFFSILGLWFFWRWWDDDNRRPLNLAISFIAIGAATSVKWIGIGALGAIGAFLLIEKLLVKKPLGLKPKHFALLLLIPLVYVATFIPDFHMRPNQSAWSYFSWWHQNAFEYHVNLKATHPYGSDWYTWPIVLRPVWLYYKNPQPGVVVGMIEIGNVVSWIAGLVALIVALLTFRAIPSRKLKEIYLFLILSYAALWLPWMLISRVKFIYHYFVPVLVLLILLANVINDYFMQHKDTRWIGWTIILFSAAFFIYFLPLVLGMPISQASYSHHLWYGRWWI